MKIKNIANIIIYVSVIILITYCGKTDLPENREDEYSENLSPEQKAVEELILNANDMPSVTEGVSEDKNDWKPKDVDSTKIGTCNDYVSITSKDAEKATIVKVKKEYSITTNPDEFVTLDPWDMLYPGCLIQGGSLIEGIPSAIPIYSKRKPGRIYLNIVSGNTTNGNEFYEETDFRPSSVTQAMNNILSKHLKSQPAKISIKIESVSSIEEMALSLGLNLKIYGAKLRTSFGTSFSETKSYVAVMLNQTFFTMSYDGPDGGMVSGTFTEDIKPSDLKPYTGNGNPICYVKSVSYGRRFILLYESEESDENLRAALNFSYGKDSSNSASSLFDSNKILKKAKCKLIQIGGDPQSGLEAFFGDMEKIRKFVEKGATASTTNLGVPISYKICQLSNDNLVRLANTSNFTATERLYLPANDNKKNSVVLDLNQLSVRTTPNGKKYKVSNNSTFKIKELSVVHINKYNGKMGDPRMIVSNDKAYNAAESVDNPIYTILGFNDFKVDSCKIRVKIVFEIYGEQVKDRWVIGDKVSRGNKKEFTIVRDYEYDSNENNWKHKQDIENIDKAENSFNKIFCTKKSGDVDFKISLGVRLTMNGREYPIKGTI